MPVAEPRPRGKPCACVAVARGLRYSATAKQAKRFLDQRQRWADRLRCWRYGVQLGAFAFDAHVSAFLEVIAKVGGLGHQRLIAPHFGVVAGVALGLVRVEWLTSL